MLKIAISCMMIFILTSGASLSGSLDKRHGWPIKIFCGCMAAQSLISIYCMCPYTPVIFIFPFRKKKPNNESFINEEPNAGRMITSILSTSFNY